MITKKFYLALVVFISLTIFGSGMVEAMGMPPMQPYGQPPMQPPMQQPYGSSNSPSLSKTLKHHAKIAKLQTKKMFKPHKAAKYDKKIMDENNKMMMGK